MLLQALFLVKVKVYFFITLSHKLLQPLCKKYVMGNKLCNKSTATGHEYKGVYLFRPPFYLFTQRDQIREKEK